VIDMPRPTTNAPKAARRRAVTSIGVAVEEDAEDGQPHQAPEDISAPRG
jgi:hypothetical protein